MSVTAAQGFEAGGAACGIKTGGAPDLAMVATASRQPVSAAAVFTTNKVQAAPVRVSRAHLADGRATAVILNSGNANAATGEPGLRNAERMCQLTGESLGCAVTDVLVCSTGLIGIPLPMAPVESGIPALAGMLSSTPVGGAGAARAIMTTDTHPKEATASISVKGVPVTVGAMAKGAAMLSPAMATMLCVATTDAQIAPGDLHGLLDVAVEASFHQMTVDGCTSTNDTVIVLASGASGAPAVEPGTSQYHELSQGLTAVMQDIARQMAVDAEGSTKLVAIHIGGARSDEEARRAARQVANSLLVKCSFYGQDPYWGRVLSELGASGVALEPERVSVAYGGVTVCRGGVAAEHDVEAVRRVMADREIDLACDLGLGTGSATILTSDLTHAYVDENMGTS